MSRLTSPTTSPHGSPPPARTSSGALEGLAVEEYRLGRLTRPELRHVLGFATRGELDGFLKERGIVEGISVEEFDRQMWDMDRIGL